MSIKIKTEKVITRGEKCVKILYVAALKAKDLPVAYTDRPDNSPRCWLVIGGKKIFVQPFFGTDTHFLTEGSSYPIAEFNEALATIQKAGTRLQKIKKEIKQISKYWHGTKNFTI